MKRSYQLELLDAETIPGEDLYRNLQELSVINHYLGGHKLNIVAFKKVLKLLPDTPVLEVVELGSGGGDNLMVLAKWCRKNGVKAEFTGVDLKKDCITFAEEACKEYPEIKFMCSDYREYTCPSKAHIVFSSLFCHHLNEEQLDEYLQWNHRNAQYYFINDLHRNGIAKWSIKFLTQAFSRSYLVKNDAPLSVERGFLKKEWYQSFKRNSAELLSLEWKWAFRWMLIGKGQPHV